MQQRKKLQSGSVRWIAMFVANGLQTAISFTTARVANRHIAKIARSWSRTIRMRAGRESKMLQRWITTLIIGFPIWESTTWCRWTSKRSTIRTTWMLRSKGHSKTASSTARTRTTRTFTAWCRWRFQIIWLGHSDPTIRQIAEGYWCHFNVARRSQSVVGRCS